MIMVKIYAKKVYGKYLYYVKDEFQAEIIQQLTKSKTVNQEQINALKKLGVAIKFVNNPEIMV